MYSKKHSRTMYVKYKEIARRLIVDRVKRYNQFYGFQYGRISVKNHSSRWGSCSQKGNLNFNYRLIFLPKDLFDYVVVHELCHLKELNHSPKFWSLVTQTLPLYKYLRKRLRAKRM